MNYYMLELKHMYLKSYTLGGIIISSLVDLEIDQLI